MILQGGHVLDSRGHGVDPFLILQVAVVKFAIERPPPPSPVDLIGYGLYKKKLFSRSGKRLYMEMVEYSSMSISTNEIIDIF